MCVCVCGFQSLVVSYFHMCKLCLKKGLIYVAPIHDIVRLQQRRVTWE